jgi:hypothetical protein
MILKLIESEFEMLPPQLLIGAGVMLIVVTTVALIG